MENSENKYSFNPEILAALIENGPDYMTELFRIGMNAAMRLERDSFLNAGPYERKPQRIGYANGFKPKTFSTRSGPVTFAIPQTRGTGFYPKALERGMRSERAMTLSMAEMYVQGVSTRKVKNIMEKLCWFEVSSSQVSEAAKTLDADIRAFRERPLGRFSVLYVDAEYQRVRIDGAVVDVAVLQAVGVNAEGRREVVGMSVSSSEAEVHWRTFLTSLAERGLSGLRLIVSDDHAGLRAARRAVFPAVPWQRCCFHLAQNAQAFARRIPERDEIAATVRDIFSRRSRPEAVSALGEAVRHWADTRKHPAFAEWLEENAEEAMTFFDFDARWWSRIRTSNCIERLNKEIRRRTKVVGIFPNVASCERLVGAILMEKHEEWMDGKVYLNEGKEEFFASCE